MLCCILHCPEPDQAVTASGFNRSPAGNKYHTTPESRWGLSSAWAGKDLKNSLGADFKVWREGLITPNCFINIPKCEDEAGKAQTVSASLSSYDKISHPPRGCHRSLRTHPSLQIRPWNHPKSTQLRVQCKMSPPSPVWDFPGCLLSPG